ncbi:MAG: FAD-binding protein [Candidatus Marinimicrobia bacterium]|nr:FAD-binding protein [Candidatus Neomarinimicrobiota bacterium]
MAYIKVNQQNVKSKKEAIEICPFNAIESQNDKIVINSACKMCKICINQMPEIYEFVEGKKIILNKDEWKGIVVYVDHVEGNIHPVTYELIGKAKQLAKKINHPVYCLFIGSDIREKADDLLHYGVDEVFVYDEKELYDFRIEPYTAVFEDFINNVKPTIILVGGTTIGRSLAPRVAARFRTGLTADCTILDVKENTDLDQIRPAFGGNIMAHIHTPKHRPQFSTVRYKIFDAPEKNENKSGKITVCEIKKNKLKSVIKVLEIKKKDKVKSIEEAEIIVVAGNGVRQESDLILIQKLADKLGGMVATTRPLIEAGWTDAKNQIGLSGRTVKPKLIITCGVSGSIQFVAGMNNSENIFAINSDPNAQIFKVANYGIVGDLYEILPELIDSL